LWGRNGNGEVAAVAGRRVESTLTAATTAGPARSTLNETNRDEVTDDIVDWRPIDTTGSGSRRARSNAATR
jgi:hypothetical protein